MNRAILYAYLLIGFIGCKETILHGIDEARANQITLILERAGIHSSKHLSGSNWDVRVDGEDLSAALRTIENSRILTRAENRYKPQDSSLIPSENQQSQTIERQISWAIEETLERIPGVVEAKVHLWLNKPAQFGLTSQETTARSASALLLTEPSVDLNTDELRHLLNGATGAPLGAISVIIRPNESNFTTIAPPTDIPQPKAANRISGLNFPTYLYELCGMLLTAAVILWALRRRPRIVSPKLSPAQLRKAGSPLCPPLSSEDHNHVQ